MELMKQNPAYKRCIGISYGMTADQMLYDLCLRNLEGSSFVNFQNQICSFDTEEFYSLLRFCKEYHSIIPLEGRADESSYLDEYLTLMEEGAVLCTEYEIQNIILEEAAVYFSGDKSEQEAANVIQKRVQNYLDERK